jgi:hypothetical protein
MILRWHVAQIGEFSYACKDSSVGTATRYVLDGLEIELRGGGIFSIRPYRAWGPPIFLCNGYRVYFSGVKRPGRGVDHSPSGAEVEYGESYTVPLWGIMACYRVQLNLPFGTLVAFLFP